MNETATKDFSSKQEKSIAKDLGWSVVSGSGARPCTPGDVKSDRWLGECKTHTSPDHPIRFNLSVWEKISEEALSAACRKAALFVDDGSQDLDKTWVLCNSKVVDLHDCLTIDLTEFKTMRKNVIFKGSALAKFLKDARKNLMEDIATMFPYTICEYKWEKHDVAIMPYKVFKEICDR